MPVVKPPMRIVLERTDGVTQTICVRNPLRGILIEDEFPGLPHGQYRVVPGDVVRLTAYYDEYDNVNWISVNLLECPEALRPVHGFVWSTLSSSLVRVAHLEVVDPDDHTYDSFITINQGAAALDGCIPVDSTIWCPCKKLNKSHAGMPEAPGTPGGPGTVNW